MDIPDKTFFDLSDRGDFTCRFGKRFAYLGEDYTLLTPECLWYPVCTPPVNPGNVYAVDKHFFNSTLKIRGTGDKAVFLKDASFKEREVTFIPFDKASCRVIACSGFVTPAICCGRFGAVRLLCLPGTR